MSYQCEICGKFQDKTYDASELAIIFHVSPRDNSTNDPNKFIICENCYNAIERAIATTWLSKVGVSICTDYMRVCGYCNRPAIATSQESLERLTEDWDYYKDNDKYCCDKCKERLGE